MSAVKRLGAQIFAYGLATVLPRALSFLLLPLYTTVFKEASGYGEYIFIYSWIALFNVLLTYGMETSFFRFFHDKNLDQDNVVSTGLWSLVLSSLTFWAVASLFNDQLALMVGIRPEFVQKTVLILVLDALVVVPFALLRAQEKPMRYAAIKSLNILVNVAFNIYFLLFSHEQFLGREIDAIFLANIIASALTLVWFVPAYARHRLVFDVVIWKKMLRYGLPIMIAGFAFVVNEVFDKILLTRLDSARSAGIYGACYKLSVFMTLFATAFRMGVEPFFFRQSTAENKEVQYAQVTYYFVVLGSILFLSVVVFLHPLAELFIRDVAYLEGLQVVPWVLMGALFLGVYHNLSVWYKLKDKTHIGAIISVIGAAVTLLMNVLLIPKVGYIASAWATFMAYLTMMCLSFFWGRKVYYIPYRVLPMLGYLSVSALFAYFTLSQFETIWTAKLILLLVFISFVIVREYKDLKSFLIPKKHASD
ncbi:MAG: oligosaccharide flippase family protein [Bacteroidetes bacterium]|nr:oligosaccharide flippase family protein [Bacteroidota bacterium]